MPSSLGNDALHRRCGRPEALPLRNSSGRFQTICSLLAKITDASAVEFGHWLGPQAAGSGRVGRPDRRSRPFLDIEQGW